MVGMRSVRQDGGESLWIGHSYPYEGLQEEWLLRKAMSRNTRPLLRPLNRAYVDVLVGEGYCPAMSGGETSVIMCCARQDGGKAYRWTNHTHMRGLKKNGY